MNSNSWDRFQQTLVTLGAGKKTTIEYESE